MLQKSQNPRKGGKDWQNNVQQQGLYKHSNMSQPGDSNRQNGYNGHEDPSYSRNGRWNEQQYGDPRQESHQQAHRETYQQPQQPPYQAQRPPPTNGFQSYGSDQDQRQGRRQEYDDRFRSNESSRAQQVRGKSQPPPSSRRPQPVDAGGFGIPKGQTNSGRDQVPAVGVQKKQKRELLLALLLTTPS